MSISVIPEKIADFNVYNQGNKIIGITGEVTLPSFTQKTETISGPGLLGEIDSPSIGQFGAIEQVIPFRTLYNNLFQYLEPRKAIDLTLRGAIEMLDGEGNKKEVGMRVVMRGLNKGFNPGSVAAGTPMNGEVTFELTYIMIEIDGQNEFELDKLNCVYKVHGKDVLAEIKALC